MVALEPGVAHEHLDRDDHSFAVFDVVEVAEFVEVIVKYDNVLALEGKGKGGVMIEHLMEQGGAAAGRTYKEYGGLTPARGRGGGRRGVRIGRGRTVCRHIIVGRRAVCGRGIHC